MIVEMLVGLDSHWREVGNAMQCNAMASNASAIRIQCRPGVNAQLRRVPRAQMTLFESFKDIQNSEYVYLVQSMLLCLEV